MTPTFLRVDWVRLGRGYEGRVLGNDYAVTQSVIRPFVDIRAGLAPRDGLVRRSESCDLHSRRWEQHPRSRILPTSLWVARCQGPTM